MEHGRRQYRQNKLPVLPPKHIFHGKKRNGQRQIIPHGIQAVKIIAACHQQIQGKSKVTSLLIQRLYKEKHRYYGKKRKYIQIFVISEDVLHPLYNIVEAYFRGHMPLLGNQLKIIPIHPVIIAHRNPAGRYPCQQAIYGKGGNPVSGLLPFTGAASECPAAPDGLRHIIPVLHKQPQSHRHYRQCDVNQSTPLHANLPALPPAGLSSLHLLRHRLPAGLSASPICFPGFRPLIPVSGNDSPAMATCPASGR